MELKFDKEILLDTTGMIGKTIYVDEKPYIVGCGIIYINGSGERGVELEAIEEPKPIPQPKEVEWVNGLPPVGVECEVYGALGKHNEWQECKVFAVELGEAFVSDGKIWASRPVGEFKFRKPESPEDKAKRERLEAAYDLYLAFWSASNSAITLGSFEDFSHNDNSDLKHFLAIVDKANYRCTTSS